MNREQVDRILTPIWIGFAAAEARLEELLEQARTAPMPEAIAMGGLRHQADLEEALDYLRARARTFQGDGLMVALNTGRRVFTWPNILPSSDGASQAVARWREGKTIQPLKKEA